MKKFLTIYFLIVVGLQLFFSLEFYQNISLLVSTVLANISGFLIGIFDADLLQHQLTLSHRNSGTAIRVDTACSALELTLLLWGAMLAYSTNLRSKLIGLCTGLIGVQVINIVRIISLFYIIEIFPDFFDWIHEYVWGVLLTVDVLICFSVWAFYDAKNRPPHDASEAQ